MTSSRNAINIEDLRQLARRRIARIVFDYIDGGVEDEAGLLRNREAFSRWRLVPHYLQDISRRQQTASLFGRDYASPFGIAPTGLAAFAHPGADLLLAQAAAEANVPFIMSGAATASIEQVMAVAPRHAWFQLYVSRETAVTEDLIRRAAAAGVETLVLTVDVPVHSKRERDWRNGFVPPVKPSMSCVLDMLCHPRWLAGLLRHGLPRFENWAPYAGDKASARDIAAYFTSQIPFTQTWFDLERIRRVWAGKLVLKGVLAPTDALRALDCGVDGVIVSNHGGRQLDCAPAPLEMLPAIRAAVAGQMTVMLDGGIRRGSDILKAWALGADFTFVGRPALYGVAADGLPGAQRALQILQQEIDLTLAQLGCGDLGMLTGELLREGW
ncbi:MAG: (S)-mandelate dehydrogenase [Pseudomonadota bacterium]|nr:(S)-mandelate dehydrogenase [Pseudomonadota bacterium]